MLQKACNDEAEDSCQQLLSGKCCKEPCSNRRSRSGKKVSFKGENACRKKEEEEDKCLEKERLKVKQILKKFQECKKADPDPVGDTFG